MSRSAVLALASTVFALFASASAFACGACVSPPAITPSNADFARQSGERIFFARDPLTKHSTVWVEVAFAGNPQDFGWVVPMPKVPKVGVGSRYLFDRLDQATAPRFELDLETIDELCPPAHAGGACSSAPAPFGCGNAAASSGSATGADAFSGNDHVKVVVAAQTGPYDYAVIQGDTSKSLLDWLNQSGFATPDAALPIIEAHVSKGDVFVAFRLHDGEGVQAIRPVTFDMDDAEPCVPLRLTSIAAVEEMSVVVYLAGPGRGIPKNSLHVEVNPLRLNWNAGASNYAQVLAAAIDEGGTHAFATEFAGEVTQTQVKAIDPRSVGTYLFNQPLGDAGAYAPGPLFRKSFLDTGPMREVRTPLELIAALATGNLPMTPELFSAMNDALGTNVPPVSWLNAVLTYEKIQQSQSFGMSSQQPDYALALPKELTLTTINGPMLADAVEKSYSLPLLAVFDTIGRTRTLTRLALRISPKEMTRDPVFAFSPTLPPVNNLHHAQMHDVQENCDLAPSAARLSLPELNRTYVLRSGTAGRTGGLRADNVSDPRFIGMRAASRIELLDETGPPLAIPSEAVQLVDAAVVDAHAGTPSLPSSLVVPPQTGDRVVFPPSDPPTHLADLGNAAMSNAAGCSQGRSGLQFVFSQILLVVLILRLQRKRS